MKLLTLTFITLLTSTLYASEAVQIDMHGGKDTKTPSALTEKKAEIFYGKILGIQSAKGYKYLLMEEKDSKIWIAILDAPVSVGETIGYDKQMAMKNFKSKALNKTFELVYFSSEVYLAQESTEPQTMKAMLGLSKEAK
jgi:hypothetical protein